MDLAATVDPQRLADAGNQKQQRQPRVADHVAQGVQPVVAAPVGQHQRVRIFDVDEARRVAPRRAVEPFRAHRRQRHEGRSLDEGPIVFRDVIDFLQQRPLQRRAVVLRQAVEIFDARAVVHQYSLRPPN